MMKNARLRAVVLFSLFLLAGGVLSACMKFELLYDLFQYHYYNGFAFWYDRLGVDVAPASVPTFYNPLLDAEVYALMTLLRNHVSVYFFVQGLWFGALMYVAFRISALYFDLSARSGKLFAALAVAVCATGTETWFQMGTATHEIELAVLETTALYLLLNNKKRFFVSGLLLGMAAGFKLTAALYCISTGITLILFYKTLDKPLKSIAVFALGGLIGFLVIDGFWMVKLWNLYGNPFFPFWNGVFKSPYFPEHNYVDTLHLHGKTFWDRLFAPFFMIMQHRFSVDRSTVDPRFATAVVVGVAALVLCRKRINRRVLFAGVYAVVAFVFWEIVSFNSRFLIPVEIVVGILLTDALCVFWKKHPELTLKTAAPYTVAGFLLYAFLAVPFVSDPWGRLTSLNFIQERVTLPENSALWLKGDFAPFVAADVLRDNPQARAVTYSFNKSISDWNMNRYGKMAQAARDAVKGRKLYALMDKIFYAENQPIDVRDDLWDCTRLKMDEVSKFNGKHYYFLCELKAEAERGDSE